ncbi:hypothetical protein SZ64_00450 [Erythrobacter sp. SG61-1L]|nr:hypothetical protein SZ64_00450 [Erythrobacter sp. SG61-1L]
MENSAHWPHRQASNRIEGQVDLNIALPRLSRGSEWGTVRLGPRPVGKCIAYVAAGNSATDIHTAAFGAAISKGTVAGVMIERISVAAAGVVKRHLSR